MNKNATTCAALEKRLHSATTSWDRLPILIALTRELVHYEPQRIHSYAMEAFLLAKELNDPFWIACSLCAISIHHVKAGQHSEALCRLKEASDIFARLNDLGMKAEADFMIAQIYVTTSEFVKAMELLPALSIFFKETGESRFFIQTLSAIGDVHRLTGDWGKGLKYYRRALRLAPKTGVQVLTAILYHRVAASYHMMEEYERYRKYMRMSLAIYWKNVDKQGIAITMGNIANSYLDENRFDEAEKYVRHSGKLYRELGYIAYEAIAWTRLGAIYEHRGELDKAFRSFKRGLALARRGEAGLILGNVYEYLGSLCVRIGHIGKGFFYLHKALEIADRSGQPYHRYKVHERLADAYEMSGDPGNALRHYKRSAEIKSEHVNSRKLLDVCYAEMREEFRTIARQLKEEQSRNDDLTNLVRQKEAELLALALELTHKNEAFSILRESKAREPYRLGQPINEDRQSTNPSANWDTFARQFHKVHQTFYFKLIKDYPTLTPTEVKICSLIRIGLSSKEIASILCISKRTVDTHRVKIHRKMSLPSSNSLSAFIVGI